MKMTKLFKILGLITLSTILAISSGVGVFFLLKSRETDTGFSLPNGLTEDISEAKLFQNRILRDSYLTGNEIHYQYDGYTFTSENDLNEYIFNKGDVQSYVTAVDPGKAIIDYNALKLDSEKVFNTNINNFTQVYRDKYGNTQLNLDDALSTYVRDSDIVIKYGYGDNRWYLTEAEAKKAVKRDLKVQKSLYYWLNGRYYNAFNLKDIEELVRQMEDGYNVELTNTLLGGTTEKVINRFGRKANINDLLKADFKQDFINNYWESLADFDGISKMRLRATNHADITVKGHYWASESKWHSVNLTFANPYKSFSEMKRDFTDESKWRKFGNDGEDESLKGYTRFFDLIINGKVEHAEVRLSHEREYLRTDVEEIGDKISGIRVFGYKRFKFSDLEYSDESTGTITLFKDKERTEKYKTIGPKKGIFEAILTNDEMSDFYSQWFDYYSNNVITNFGNKANEKLKWFDLINNYYVTNDTKDFLAGKIYKDKLYAINPGNGYGNSIIESYKEWLVRKEDIIEQAKIDLEFVKKNPKSDFAKNFDEDKPYYVDGIYVSLIDLNNHLSLKGNIETRIMYSASDEDHPSDQTGRFLANTEQQAIELLRLFSNSDNSIKIKHSIEIDGKEHIIDPDNLEYSKRNIKSQITIESKFIHNKEADKLRKNQRLSWDALLSSGTYTVYATPHPYLNEKMFFLTREAALDAVKSVLNVDKNLKTFEIRYFVYNFLTKEGEILPIRYSENQIEEIADSIYKKEKGNKIEWENY